MPISLCNWCLCRDLTLFFSCRHTPGRLPPHLPCFHVHRWFVSSPPGTISLQTEIMFNLSLRSISCAQHRRLFHLCSIFISKSDIGALTPSPPTVPSAAGWRRAGGRLWRGKGRSCSWCHNGWSCATTSCGTTSVSNTSWRWETWRRGPPPPKKNLDAERTKRGVKIDVSCQTLCSYVLDDLYEHPALEKDVRELQKLYMLHRRQWVTVVNTRRLMGRWFQR